MNTLHEHYRRQLGLEEGSIVLCVELYPEEHRVRFVIEWELGREGCCVEGEARSRGRSTLRTEACTARAMAVSGSEP
jgi:hypothetical protein